jgi:predicted amidophosphoribosyltransferase
MAEPMEDVKYICAKCGAEAKTPGPCPDCEKPLVASCPVCGNPVVGDHIHTGG